MRMGAPPLNLPSANEELENRPNSTPSAQREVSSRRRLVHGADAALRKAA